MQTDIESNNESLFDIIDNKKDANLAETKNKSSKIENILEKLSGDNLENIQDLKKDIKKFYDTNKRHRYSDITSHLFHLHMKQDGKIDNIRKNIQLLIDEPDNTEQLKDNLLKLQDHILLEIVRLNNIKEIKQEIEKTSKEVQESKIEIEKTSKEVQESKIEIEKTSKEVQESKQSYITILGIFAAIMLAFVSGLNFSNSVLSNIDKVSIYRLIFVMAFIALFVGNILKFLFDFLLKISGANNKVVCYKYYIFNAILFIVMVVDIIYYIYCLN
ncbi:coiled-coil domain-containing protein [Campylobacter insulaenigrae]|uniref:coiled-coil domain-containing protein n=1 Tax=Campylobacter insulaenigrae TaxID=260714 RepID=UPI0021538F10|nr:Atg14 domain-containing protein [Campylobacter insulaenigrae]MCR6570825.1 Atg14 domain-containing protein [Campylobacter insulaenigrae]MCR6583145.1 Atg14 domain-containing protein [Campylobacter insulaenigrae]